MTKYFLILVFLLTLSLHNPSFAEDINTQSIDAEGFAEVSKIYNQMTPEQREAIKNKALEMQKELEAMTPEERDTLIQQMKVTLQSIDTSKVDVTKIDPSKSKGLKNIQSDIQEYKKINQEKAHK
jgi:hypothetical protein